MSLSRIIQSDIPIGSEAVFTLKDGQQIRGILVRIGLDHIALNSNGELITVLLEMIGTWRCPTSLDSESADRPSVPTIPPEPNTPYTGPIEQGVLKKLTEIKVLFEAQQHVSSIQINVPDFIFPANEIQSRQNNNAQTVWNRVRDRYQYAEKINELSVKFGRIQPLVSELLSLLEQYPHSTCLKRHLAYFYHLLGDHQKSLALYQAAASISDNALDWYNLAAKALLNSRPLKSHF